MPTNTNSSPTRVNDWLTSSQQVLRRAGIGTARLDCLVLLEDTIFKDRSWLLANPEFELTKAQINKLDSFVKRRAKHEPLAYIRSKTEFYGREFIITKDVLEPRPESETMIDMLKKLADVSVIADIGTGSGALGVTAVLEIPNSAISLVDIDDKCLDIAAKNLKKHNVKAEVLQGDLLEPLKNPVDVILANLPYVPDSYTLNDAAMQEPRVAIFGGKDGLDVYRKLFAQIAKLSQKPRYILTESLPFQHLELAKIANHVGYKQIAKNDFIQVMQSKASVPNKRD